MVVIRRQGATACLLLSGLLLGILGTSSRAQAPAATQQPPPPTGPQEAPPPPPPEARVPAPSGSAGTAVEALPATPDEAAAAEANGPASRAASARTPVASAGGVRVYVAQEPPPPIAERPSGERPGPSAVWTSGYWDWEPAGTRYVWVAGSWRVPPAGTVWVNGRWRYDVRGWYRVDGTWKRPADAPNVVARNRPARRISGPPAEHPDDTPPPAPGPDFFYIAGHYSPVGNGNRLAWVPGFWTAEQPGWDWVPARWIRRPDGWDYRDGHWMRAPINGVMVDVEVPGTGLGHRGRRRCSLPRVEPKALAFRRRDEGVRS